MKIMMNNLPRNFMIAICVTCVVFTCIYCSIESRKSEKVPMIYAITPTYARATQKADLTRLSHTLRWLENFHWIVVEDSLKPTSLVTNFLKESKLKYTHLVAYQPMEIVNDKKVNPGLEQRNAGLEWIRKTLKDDQLDGVVYFMDDDNTYSLKIFEEMRKVKHVGVWPVGLVGGRLSEKPLLDPTGERVVGFDCIYEPERKFGIDMAGFAIHLTLIMNKNNIKFTQDVKSGFQESEILEKFTTREKLEPLADKCKSIYVWHTRTETPFFYELGLDETSEV